MPHDSGMEVTSRTVSGGGDGRIHFSDAASCARLEAAIVSQSEEEGFGDSFEEKVMIALVMCVQVVGWSDKNYLLQVV